MLPNYPPCLSPADLSDTPSPAWDIQNQVVCDRLLRLRIEERKQALYQLLADTQHNWEEAFYISLSRSFGFHTNSRPMEQLARQTPLSYLNKHRDSLFQLTALLLGQAGLLPDTPSTQAGQQSYTSPTQDTQQLYGAPTQAAQQLYKEYTFLQKKFSLTPIDATQWRRAGVSPDVRIRQLAQLLHKSEFLFSRLMDATSPDKMAELLTLTPSHPQAAPSTPTQHPTTETPLTPSQSPTDNQFPAPPPIGRSSIEKILLNVVFPYQYAYHHYRNQPERAEQALSLYRLLPAEDNQIVRRWRQAGQIVLTAADSQALLQLTTAHCTPTRCARCLSPSPTLL